MARTEEELLDQLLEDVSNSYPPSSNDTASPEEPTRSKKDIIADIINSTDSLEELKNFLSALIRVRIIKINTSAINDLYEEEDDSP